MAAGDIPVTIIGNLVDDPQLRYTPSGMAVASFRVASTPRVRQSDGTWEDGDSVFMTCNIWRRSAENAAESLIKGTRVIVMGKIRQRSYEKDGTKHTVYEVEADEVGPSLRNASAKVTKAQRRPPGQDAAAPAESKGGFADEPPF